MAGQGSRFKQAGFDKPKPQIEVKGKTLFEWSLTSLLNFKNEDFIFVYREEVAPKNFILQKCKDLGFKSVELLALNQITSGQAETVSLVKPIVTSQDPILIYNIDTYVEPDVLLAQNIKGDGWLPAFEAEGDKWSFVKFDQNHKVFEVTEKIRISQFATIGLYYFSSFEIFETAYKNYDFSKYKETYVAPLYSWLIQNKFDVYTQVLPSSKVHVLGTPEDLVQFGAHF